MAGVRNGCVVGGGKILTFRGMVKLKILLTINGLIRQGMMILKRKVKI
jgi:hypothetical protein